MDRSHWIAAGKALLSGYLAHLDESRAEFAFPNSLTPTHVPSLDELEVSGRFEAFTRTFMLMAALLRTDPALELVGVRIRDLCVRSMTTYFDPDSSSWIGDPAGGKSPFQLVQWSGLILGFLWSDELVWSALEPRIRDAALENLLLCADHRTNAHNWRFFNLMAFSFLDMKGVPIDTDSEAAHLDHLASWYCGDGWYRDGKDFDYYNAWAFQYYAAIWTSLPRAASYRDVAEQFRSRFRVFMESYPRFFSRDGRSLLWGRSAAYRFAAAAPLAVSGLIPEPNVGAGAARRIASQNMLHFLSRHDVWHNGVPTMGYYRSFQPVLQYYVRETSFGWMHKLFGALALPTKSPFWTERESLGSWESSHDVGPLHLPCPGITVCNFGESGVTILVPGKVRSAADICYNRLAYHSHLVLEDDAASGATSMQYSAGGVGGDGVRELRPAEVRFAGFRGGVLYKQLYLGEPGGHHSEGCLIDLAEVLWEDGIVRIDRLRSSFPVEVRLASFGIPGTVVTRSSDNQSACEIRGERDHATSAVAVRALAGWQRISLEQHTDLNAETRESSVIRLDYVTPHVAAGTIQILSHVLFVQNTERCFDESQCPRLRGRQGEGSRTVQLPGGEERVVDFACIESRFSD